MLTNCSVEMVISCLAKKSRISNAVVPCARGTEMVISIASEKFGRKETPYIKVIVTFSAKKSCFVVFDL